MSLSAPISPGPSGSRLQLLLARAGDHKPVLEHGLAEETLLDVPRVESPIRRADVPTLASADADRNDLAEQRWGVIAPEKPLGDVLLRAIALLIDHREKEQGAPVKRYFVKAGMTTEESRVWKETVLQAEDVPEEERPWFLLVLGDLHHVSIELQQLLAEGACVGRLHVGRPDGEPDLSGYTAYVNKVLACEQRTSLEEAPSLLLYAARDGTEQTDMGDRFLVQPCRDMAQKHWKARWPTLEPLVIPYDGSSPAALLRVAGETRAGVMLSVAHGLSRPEKGWASPEEQRAIQGDLSVGTDQALTGKLLRDTPFLPGGMWFSVACFGAATPATSAFHPWLTQLKSEHAPEALKSLPCEGERPFMAALPQALLANEQGPLAIIGHSDLAWVMSFTDAMNPSVSRASRILSALKVLANGSRAGVAHFALMSAYQEASYRLLEDYQVQSRASQLGRPEDPKSRRRQGSLWMQRNDLRGYVLLGDPAARMAVKRQRP
jgi:hypothetical protein